MIIYNRQAGDTGRSAVARCVVKATITPSFRAPKAISKARGTQHYRQYEYPHNVRASRARVLLGCVSYAKLVTEFRQPSLLAPRPKDLKRLLPLRLQGVDPLRRPAPFPLRLSLQLSVGVEQLLVHLRQSR